MNPRAYLGKSTSLLRPSKVSLNESFGSHWVFDDRDRDAEASNKPSGHQDVKSYVSTGTPDGPAGVPWLGHFTTAALQVH